MYNTSAAYRTAIAARTVKSEWYGTITTTAGNVISYNSTNLDQSRSKMTGEYATGETLELGTAFSKQLTLALRGEYTKYQFYNASVTLNFRLWLTSSTYEDVPCGTFIIADAEFTYNSVTMTGYDYMQKFSGKISDMADASPYSALSTICSACGVTLGSTQAEIEAMVNGTVTLPLSVLETKETYKNVLGYIAGILCGNAVIGRDDYLYIKNYSSTAVRDIGVSSRYNSSYVDYIGRYTTIAITDAEGDEQTYTKSGTYTETLLTLSMGTNPLINGYSDVDTMVQAIVDEIGEISFAPCDITMVQDASLDLGDMVTISGGNIESPVSIIVTKQDQKLFGQMGVKSVGGNYTLAEKKTKVEAEIADVATVAQTASQQVAQVQEEIATLEYSYVEPQVTSTSAIADGGAAIVMSIYFTLEAATQVKFGSTMNFLITPTTSGGTANLNITYGLDSETMPVLVQTYSAGYHVLTLDYLTEELTAGSHVFSVAFGMVGGALS